MLAIAIAILAAGATIIAWQTSAPLARIEARLHEADPFAEFVDRAAPGFELTSAEGDAVRLKDFRGKAVLLNFIYARCTDICPPHMARLGGLQERIRQAGLAGQVELVTLATDTEDRAATARLLRQYGERFGLRDSNWRILYRGNRPPRAVIELAAGYGLEFRVVTADGGYGHTRDPDNVERQVHGAVFHVIDPAGRMRARLHGLRFESRTLITYLRALNEADLSS